VDAEPKIVEAVLSLLEDVSGKPRRKADDPLGPYALAVLKSKPTAYWRLGEMAVPRAFHHGTYEPGVALCLPGPNAPGFSEGDSRSRAAHFAGGRVQAKVKGLGETYSVEAWIWNGLPADARAVTGYFFSRGADRAEGAPGDHLGIGGTHGEGKLQGKLFVYNGDWLEEVLVGKTEIAPQTWNHVVFVRDRRKVTVYLNGETSPEISGEAAPGHGPGVDQLFLGGRNDGLFNFEGKMDEVALYDRALSAEEAASHFRAAGAPLLPEFQP
jgi:hypothetical protein